MMNLPTHQQVWNGAASRTTQRVLHNLPAAVTPFIGRDAERAQLVERLRDPTCRLLTVTGAGGVGKTRLALEVGRSLVPAADADTPFAHGVRLVSLAALDNLDLSNDLLATTIASALGLALSGPDEALDQVAQYLSEKALLLIFDNFEQVLGGAGLIARLLQDAPYLKILATSRERLNIRGERVFELAGLPFPDERGTVGGDTVSSPSLPRPVSPADIDSYDAVQLFIRMAQSVDPDFALTAETARPVARICQLVEGLPLGIELAAAWVRVFSCDEIAHEIAQNLDFLSSTTQDLPARQQSLRAVFDYSWALLSEAERQALGQIAVFRGSFNREAFSAVVRLNREGAAVQMPNVASARLSADTLPLLVALVDKSLVRRAGAGGAARYEMVELLRQYAAQKLDPAGEAASAPARHAAYYTNWMAARTPELRGPSQPEALAAIGTEIEQIRAAWRWGVAQVDAGVLGRITDSLFHFYDIRSWFQEGAEAFGAASRVLAGALDQADRLVYGQVLARHGWFTFHLGRQADARDLLEQSLALLRGLVARADLIFPLNYLGAVYSYLGAFDRTRALCNESLAIAESVGDLYGRAIACNILGQASYELGAHAEARTWHQQSLAIEQQIGNRWSMAYSLTNLGKVALAQRQYDEARGLFEQALRIREEIGDIRGVGIGFNRLGEIAVARGDTAEAGQRFAQSLALFREIGNQWGMALSLINLGRLAAANQRDIVAIRLFQEALRLARTTQSAPQIAQILAATVPVARRLSEAGWSAELAALDPSAPAAGERAQTHADRLLAWVPPGLAAMTLEQALDEAQRVPPAAPPAGPVTQVGYPAGLTAREVAVLRLVAQGLTDAQVAERLIVSPRTVSTHLTSIYGKLGVSSRAAATRFAVENGLV
jgi:predicted ATPase/DNA-binding NarL/FixJ family response regulator